MGFFYPQAKYEGAANIRPTSAEWQAQLSYQISSLTD